MQEVCKVLGVKKVNTTAYHPQTDGLVERFNRTLTSMLAKRVKRIGEDWDQHLPYVLFAYQASIQESTQESPFFLLHGHDPRLPSALDLEPGEARTEVDLDSYKGELVVGLTEAWDLARKQVLKAQKAQKRCYDRHAKERKIGEGDRVFVYMPGDKVTKAYKFARPFHGPYRVLSVTKTGVTVYPIDRPQEEGIRVALNRIRRCPDPIPNVFWPVKEKRNSSRRPSGKKAATENVSGPETSDVATSVWRGRLRGSSTAVEDAHPESGDM